MVIDFTYDIEFDDETKSQINKDIDKYFIFQWTERLRDPPTLPPLDELPSFVPIPAPSKDPETGELI